MSGPTTGQLLDAAIETAISSAEATGEPIAALDAGCGSASALASHRARISRFVGTDIHPAAPGSVSPFDEFVLADLCSDAEAFEPGAFDLALSNFTVEHLADPPRAMANVRRWLKPGGRLILVTVNRRHPFVAAYLRLPVGIRRRLQRLVKATTADAHPLVGACNTPGDIHAALLAAGFIDLRIQAVGHLAAAWGRRRWTRFLGRLGDRLVAGRPSRRSTLVVTAVAPGSGG